MPLGSRMKWRMESTSGLVPSKTLSSINNKKVYLNLLQVYMFNCFMKLILFHQQEAKLKVIRKITLQVRTCVFYFTPWSDKQQEKNEHTFALQNLSGIPQMPPSFENLWSSTTGCCLLCSSDF